MGDLSFPEPPSPPVAPWKSQYRDGRSDYVGLTPEALEVHKAAWLEYENAFKVWRARCSEIAGQAATLLSEHGFPSSVRVWTEKGNRGRSGGRVSRPLKDVLASFAPPAELKTLWVSHEEDWLRSSGARQREKEIAERSRALRDRAVAWLLARGKTYGEDFTADTATAVALDIAANEKLTEMVKPGVYHGFDGWNCHDIDDRVCRGWDGESRRCDCGNRRVSWTFEGTFEQPVVRGEAW